MSPRLSLRDLALVLGVVALFGYSFVMIKVALRETQPFALAAARFALAAFPACLFVPRPRMPTRAIVAYGFAIGVFQFGLMFLAIHLGMAAGVASVVIQVQVFFTMALAMVFLHERLHAHNAIGAVIAATGVAVLAAHGIVNGAAATLLGFALVIAAALGWAIGNVVAKHAGRDHEPDMLGLVVWSSLVPPLPLALLSIAVEGGVSALQAFAHMSLVGWLCLLGLAYGATVFGFASWNRLLHRYPASLVSPFALLIPVSGLASGMLFLDEHIAPLQALGIALLLLGLIVNVWGPRWRLQGSSA